MRINFDFTDLEVFLAVKDAGSFHRAAEKLDMSQPSVTRRIAKLEEALDSLLFERTTRAVRPTLAAKRLETRAEAILNDAHEAARAMRDETMAFAHQRAQTVTLATLPTVVPHLVAPALAVFRRALPQARVRLLDLAANEVAEAVAGGDADIGLCSVPMLEPVTEFEPLFSDSIVLAMHADHRLADQETVGWDSLGHESLILPARGTGNRLLIDEAMARMQVPIRWTFEVGRSATAIQLVAGGLGLAPLPFSALRSDFAGLVVSRRITRPDIARSIGLLTRIGQRDRSAARRLIAALRDVAATLR